MFAAAATFATAIGVQTVLLASGVTVDVNGIFLLLTPVALAVIAFFQKRAANEVAAKVEEVKGTAEQAKQETDAKLEVIRVDVNSNLTKALNELRELREHFNVVEGQPLPPAVHGTVMLDRNKL